jgi:NAD+ synthase
MQAVQREIAEQLKVQPPFADEAALEAEVARRVTFIQDCLVNSGLKTLVLGISGGVDSLTAGLLAQRAMRELRKPRATAATSSSPCACRTKPSSTNMTPRPRWISSSPMNATP